jgi:Subtilase family
MGLSDNFESRIEALPWVTCDKQADGSPVLAVSNQLLVDAAHDAVVMAAVHARGIRSRLLTTLFDGMAQAKKVGDVNVYELTANNPASVLLQRNGIFKLTDQVRGAVFDADKIPPKALSPNHILVPASLGASCPAGAPFPYHLPSGEPQIQAPDPHEERIRVTVIDSGWQWDAAWTPGGKARDPLYGHVTATHAERVPMAAEVPAAAAHGHWEAGQPEKPGQKLADGHLLALAGHANFIAGVIARRCRQAKITVVSHNGTFLLNNGRVQAHPIQHAERSPDYYDFPTEAAVARSLCRSMSFGPGKNPHVIDIGFAFLPWTTGMDDGTFLPANDVVSAIWERAFEYVGTQSPKVVVIAPAGNQQSSLRRYPAALAKKGAAFANVVGVASIDDPNPPEPMPAGYPALPSAMFTNTGAAASAAGPADDWATCSAVGSGVISTFLWVDAALEDSTPHQPDNVYQFRPANAWAVWNGTSFAAPKVVAGIANAIGAQLAGGNPADPPGAWNTVAGSGIQALAPGGHPELGIQLPGLH